MGNIGKRIALIHLKPPPPIRNPNPNQPCSHCEVYGHDENHYFTLHLELLQGQSQTTNVRKNKRKCAINKGSTTKLTPNQPNTMLGGFNDEHGNKVKSNIGLILSKVEK